MDHHHQHLVNKVSRFFPSSFTSSCKSSIVPDVVESSITIAAKKPDFQPPPRKPFSNVAHKNSPSMTKKVSRSHKKALPLGPPPLSTAAAASSQVKEKVKAARNKIITSTSSNSGRWFTDDDDEGGGGGGFDGKSDAFFSLSSFDSSESFRQKRGAAQSTSTSWRRYDNKAFNDFLGIGRCSSALSAYSVNTALSQGSREKPENQERLILNNKPKTWETCPKTETFNSEDEIFFKGCEVVLEDLTELYYGGSRRRRHRKTGDKSRRKRVKNEKRRESGEEMRAAAENRVGDSYAVEKSSRDPYGDFRTSMVEMIIEKQIFGAKDLEKLLDCFLSLNSSYYHRIIVEVFIEICETLFGI